MNWTSTVDVGLVFSSQESFGRSRGNSFRKGDVSMRISVCIRTYFDVTVCTESVCMLPSMYIHVFNMRFHVKFRKYVFVSCSLICQVCMCICVCVCCVGVCGCVVCVCSPVISLTTLHFCCRKLGRAKMC